MLPGSLLAEQGRDEPYAEHCSRGRNKEPAPPGRRLDCKPEGGTVVSQYHPVGLPARRDCALVDSPGAGYV